MVMGRRCRAALQHKIISNLPLIKSTVTKIKRARGGEGEGEKRGEARGKHNSGFMASITDISHLV